MRSNPVHTRIALLVSLMSLGWSSASAANESLVPGPLAPPEPATPFGTPGWPENWSFDLPVATRSADDELRVAVPADTARRPKGRFKTGAAPPSFHDYSPAGQHYVCLDVETGVLASAATGCRVPAVLPDGALAAAEASALFFGSAERRQRGGEPTAEARRAADEETAATPHEGSVESLTAAGTPGPLAETRERPARRKAAEVAAKSPSTAIAKSTIRPDLAGFHDACPFSVPDHAALAQASAKATLTDSSTAKSGGKRSAQPAKAGKQVAAAPVEQVGKVKASKSPLRTAAASDSPAAKRKAARVQATSQPKAERAGSEAGHARAQSVRPEEAPFATPAPATSDGSTATNEEVREATRVLADLRFVHEEDPFLLADAAEDQEPSQQAARQKFADTSPVVEAYEVTLPALSGSYPFWLPGDAATMMPRVPMIGAVAEAGPREAIDTVPVQVIGIVVERSAAPQAPATAAALAEAATEVSGEVVAQEAVPGSALEAEPVEVYGVLADEYAAETVVAHSAAEDGSTAVPGSSGTEMARQESSALDDAPVEVYGALADEYAAIAAQETGAAQSPAGPVAEHEAGSAPVSAFEVSSTPIAAEVPSLPVDDVRSVRRVEVDVAADVGRATAGLLAALEQWVALVAMAETVARSPSASPKGSEQPAEGLFAKGSVAVAETALDGVRGGFDNGSGLRVSFGIERAVYINGNLVTTTNFNLADLGKVSGGNAAPVPGERPDVGLVLIQNGPGNFVQPGIAQSAAGTVIQNTLSNQNISSVTLVNATVNSLQMFKGLDLHSTLRNVITSAVPR